MNNSDLAEKLAAAQGISKADARKYVDAVFAVITDAAAEGEEVSLNGFGKFKIKESPAREGRNPSTGDTIQIAASKKLNFAAAKAVKETRYHLRYSSSWLIRLGDGTTESHDRAQAALGRIWKFTTELRTSDATELELAATGVAPDPAVVAGAWSAHVDRVLAEATLARPADQPYQWFGKQGRHTEHLGHLLTDLQYLSRAVPGASW